MSYLLLLVELVVLASLLSLVAAQRMTLEDYLNTCIDAKYHKSKPGKEDTLFSQCSQWSKRSCCTREVTEAMQVAPKWHNLDWNHCPHQPLSPPCRKYLMQDLCFYECSPNVGPWVVPHNISIRNERFAGVPLCKAECDSWFNACRSDFTCSGNWAEGWDWSTGENRCPSNSTCRTFQEVFQNADTMCANIWGGSFKVVPDTEPCMLLWFNGDVNPNDVVSFQAAMKLVNAASQRVTGSVSTIISTVGIILGLQYL